VALSAFDDKSHEATSADREATLGRSIAQWRGLVSRLETE